MFRSLLEKCIFKKAPLFFPVPRVDDQCSSVLLEEPGGLVNTGLGFSVPLSSPSRTLPHSLGFKSGEIFSRKVFVGGLPCRFGENMITARFCRFGPLVVDWPDKAESKSFFPPKAYAFLLFQNENSVQSLIDACITDEDKLYVCVSSSTIKDTRVQIRPWRLSDADFILDASMPLDPRKTVFVGGVPCPLKAVELAMIMDRLYGGVCYAGIDTDLELKYPKGAGRVAFNNLQSYIDAISVQFVQLQHSDISLRIEIRPYKLDDQLCDECQVQRCGGKLAPFFCANVMCMQAPLFFPVPRIDNQYPSVLLEEPVLGFSLPLSLPSRCLPHSLGSKGGERFSRKVFVGGLPHHIGEDMITASFCRFGPLVVDWPHKAEKPYFPPNAYAFLLFQDENSVQSLINACITDANKLYFGVSSHTIKNKPVQIKPWRLSDAGFVLDASMPLDPRKTVFVFGVPSPLKAVELAMIMDRLYGGVCYAGIDTDPELKYPKGVGRVAFSNQQSYIAAISARFVQLQHGNMDKRVVIKPIPLDDQLCDECQGQRCGGKLAPFFCANVMCLQYYCEQCWATIHSRPGREYHKPLVKEGPQLRWSWGTGLIPSSLT